MTSVAATSAAAEEASELLALRRKEREQAAGGLEEGGAYITDAASMAVGLCAIKECGPQFVAAPRPEMKVFKTIFEVRSCRGVSRWKAHGQRLKEIHGKIIEPTGWFMGYWDGITFSSLIFTAVVTPVEVGIFGDATAAGSGRTLELPLFVLNRMSGRGLHPTSACSSSWATRTTTRS